VDFNVVNGGEPEVLAVLKRIISILLTVAVFLQQSVVVPAGVSSQQERARGAAGGGGWRIKPCLESQL